MPDSEILIRTIVQQLAESTRDRYRATKQLELLNFLEPSPASLPFPKDELEKRKENIVEHFNGVPALIFVLDSAPPPQFDSYINAIIYEMERSLLMARRSVCDIHSWWIVNDWVSENPERIEITDAIVAEQICGEFQDIFWEQTETAIIRLSSYWDRVGQLLDFVFFNVRQYDRDGFSAIAVKIRNNYAKQFERLAEAEEWKRLWTFHNSSKEDGLQWILQRRNLVIHSLHLASPNEKSNNSSDTIFSVAHNHYENKKIEKLKQGTSADEVKVIHAQLEKACSFYSDILTIAEMGAEINKGN